MPAPILAAAAPSLIAAGGSAVLGGISSAVSGGIASRKGYHNAKKLAILENDLNKGYLDYYNEYNTPMNQRLRMEEAGYNPNLFYGQGNPGNQSSPQQSVHFQPRDFSHIANIYPMMMQSMMAQTQIRTQNAQVNRSIAQTELAKVQTKVAEANPYLDKEAFNAMVDSLKATAMIKGNEAAVSFMNTQTLTQPLPQNRNGLPVGQQKILAELDLLVQKFGLGNADLKIKAEVFNSKQFQNAILEVQKKFMADGDVSQGQFLQFISMLILKAM